MVWIGFTNKNIFLPAIKYLNLGCIPVWFKSMLNGSEKENAETQVWHDFSMACKYITQEKYDALIMKNDEAGKLIWCMINNPEKYI